MRILDVPISGEVVLKPLKNHNLKSSTFSKRFIISALIQAKM